MGFVGGEQFLAEEGGRAGGVGVEEGVDDLAGDPDGEDGHGVVEGVVLGEGGPVEDCWGGGEGG